MNAARRTLPFVSVTRALRFLAGSVLAVATTLTAWAQPAIPAPATGFTAAEVGRTFMTVGGVWNGATEVTNTTGDTFSVTYNNTGDATAFDFTPRVLLQPNFQYVPGTAQVVTNPATPGLTVSAVQVGNQINFTFNPAGYDLPAGTTLTLSYGLRTTTAVTSGTYPVNHERTYSLTDGGAQLPAASPGSQNILVQAGATTLNVTPKQQIRAVGQTAEFTVTITNTGLGGLFDVTLDESAINPGNNLQLLTLIKTAPALAASLNVDGDVLTLPYLAPGQAFVATVEAEVLSCGTIINIVATDDRTAATAATDQAPVQLNLQQPLVSYAAPVIALDYNAPAPVSLTINNTGAGDARGFSLHTTLPARAVTITNVGAGWTYNAGTGVFTLTANAGVIANAGSATLTFDVQATDICASSGAGSVSYEARYTNGCGDAYVIPQTIGSVTAAADTPNVTLTKGVSENRIAIIEAGTYTLTLGASNLANISTDPLVVTDTLPAGVTYAAHTASIGSVNVVGQVVTWTVAKAALAADQTLEIDFTVDNEPCLAGTILNNTASVSATSSQGCAIGDTANATFLVSNNPGLASNQFFNVTPNAPDGIFETGFASADAVRDPGEGEFIPFEARYEFGPLYPGTWAGTTYEDDFGGVTQQTLVPGTLTYRFNGGAPTPVPPASITPLASGFRINLAYLGGAVAGTELQINYQTTIPDAALTGATLGMLQRTNLVLGGIDPGDVPGGICDEVTSFRFTQGAYYTVGRAAATIGLSMPSQLEVCREETLTITIDNANAEDAHNVLVTLLNGGSEFLYPAAQVPVYGGAFNAGNITYTANAGVNPTFQYTGDPLAAQGTIQVRVIRRATSPVNTSGFSARVDYDSSQTDAAGSRVYSATANYAPSVVRKANLALTVTPGSITVAGQTASYVIFVTNTDAGTGYGSKVAVTLPAGITPNAAAMNTANAGPDVFVVGQDIEFDLGDLPSGTTVQRTVIGDVGIIPGCSITITSEKVQASWGCEGDIFFTTERVHPAFFFPPGQMQVVHDSTNSFVSLCSEGLVELVVRNTGATSIQNITVNEVLPSAQGVLFKPGSVEIRINGAGPWTAAADPGSIVGDSHTWTSAQIPALARLVPVGANIDDTTTYEVRIRFRLLQTEIVAGQSPLLSASANGSLACGSPVNFSPGSGFPITVFQPDVTLVKTGRNLTAGQTAYVENVYGGAGDVIEWRIQLANTGNLAAQHVRLSDALSGSGGAAEFSSVQGTVGISTLGDPGTPYTANSVETVVDLAADNGSATYYFREQLGASCDNTTPQARVSWGCSAPGAGVHNTVSEPGAPTDTAGIMMSPSIAGGTQIAQTITHLNGGRARIDVAITNTGGNAYELVVTNTFPNADMVLDTTVAPVISAHVATFYPALTSIIDGVVVNNTNTLAPVFTFTTGSPAVPMLRFGDRATLTYYVRPTVFDITQATTFPDLAAVEANPALDPNPPATGNNTVRVDYESSCGDAAFGTAAVSLNLRTPDLDITAVGPNSGNTVLSATTTQGYTFTITNSGDSGSVADFITLSLPDLGPGWTYNSATLTTPGTGGSGGNAALDGGVYTFTPAQVGTLAQNQSALVTVNLTYDSAASNGSLALRLRARGESRGHDGVTAYGDYSLDQRGQRVLGVDVLKTLHATSEATSTNPSVLNGEDLTYRVRVRFRGAEGTVENIRIRDQLRRGAATNANGDNFGFVRIGATPFVTPTGAHTVTGLALAEATNNAATNGVVTSGRLTFSIDDIPAGDTATGAVAEFDLVARVMNIDGNADGNDRVNRVGVWFDYLGQRFHPPTGSSYTGLEALGGTGTAVSGLYASHQVTVLRPQLAIAKTVRNVTRATAFAASTLGEAGDVVEYRLVVTNPAAVGDRPLHSIRVTDTVPAKLNLSAADQGADTDGNLATIETPNTAGAAGLGATITFNQTNTAIAAVGQNFDQLNPGQSITLLYRGTLDASVAPSETLTNSAAAVGFSVPVDAADEAVNQVAMKTAAQSGNPANPTRAAPRRYDAATSANVVIDNIVQDKVIDTTSESGSTSPLVFIGEQIRYRITLNLPLGTAPDLSVTDTLPAGLALVGVPVVTIGADLSPATPGTLTVDGQQLTWAFGETLADGADRTITLEYVAQVRNVAGNTAGTALTNNAAYNFTGLPGDIINLTQRTVTVAEPAITIVHQVRNITRATAFAATAPADAGDILEYRVALTNPAAANRAPAYDLNFVDTLPAGLTYVPASTVTEVATGLTGTLVEPDLDGQVLTWGRTQAAPTNLDLAIGANNFEFRYRATVDDTSTPLQVYTNALVADWTSLDGAPGADLGDPILAPGDALGERTGAGVAPNTYRSALSTTTTALNTTTITKTKSGDTLPEALPASGFRVGDLITYILTLPVQEGTLAAFTLADTLPAGLAFHDTVSITPATGDDGFTYVTPVAGATAPELADTGALAWNFGTLVNTGDNDLDNDELVVVYRARVLPAAAPDGLAVIPADQTLNNTSTVAYTLADTTTHTSDASIAPVVVRQPVLTLAKEITAPAPDDLGFIVRRPGDTASYRITITNTGTAPAHNIAFTDTLPEGLRATAPVIAAATLNGAPAVLAPVWTEAAGTWVFTLADDQPLLPGQTLVLDYTVTVDADDALRGATLTNTANIDAFHSLPANDPEAASRRTYALVGPATADLVVGLRIDGFVYHDIDLSNARDGAEDWSGLKPTVFANLVAPNAGNPIVFRTVTVPAGPGDFAFDYLPPGDFTIILTDSDGNLLAQRPANWLNVTPATGAIPVTINQGTGDLADQNLGLDQGVFALTVAPTITKTATGETIPEAGPETAFRIGDIVTYTVEVFPHEGTNTTFLVADELPAGLAFINTVSIAQVAGPARYTYVTPAGVNAPAADDESTLTWNFGTFTNAIADPANNTLRITYRARVIDTGVTPLAAPAASPAPTTDALTNTAELAYANTAVSLDPIAAGPATDEITVEQPRLVIAKALTAPALNRLPPNATGTFTVTVTNTGTAPAYNLRVTDTLPVGLRDTAPVLTAATLNGVESLAGLTAVATWTEAAGTYVFDLTDAQILLPGQTLVLAYQFTVDDAATRAATLTNSAVANRYFSKPASSPAHRREYAPTDPATADIIVGLRIAGTVYEDADLNDALTPGEDWTGATKPVVYVNLIDGLGALYASATINPGTGEFEFTNLPEDDYTLVVATTPTALVSDRPANWLYRAPNNGTHTLPATATDLVRNFGFWQDTLAVATIAKTASGQTIPEAGPETAFRIGDLVTYAIDIDPQEGDFTDFIVTDALPAGLAFVETVSIAQLAGPARYTYVEPAGANAPAADATGTLTWTFGNFANALLGPDDNTLRITYTARVLDAAGVAAPAVAPAPATVQRVNSARLDYTNAAYEDLFTDPAATATIDISQPRLAFAKTRVAPAADNLVMPGDPATFRLTVTNDGDAPAYNLALADTLPAGLRDATPVVIAATLNGADILGTLPAPAYDSGTGLWTLTLADNQPLLPGSQTFVIDYTVTVDADAIKGAVLTNSALVTAYASKPSADADERRVYDPTAPDAQSLVVAMAIDGSVYQQLITNGLKDPTENWNNGVPVFVNLVTNAPVNVGGFVFAANQVLRSVEVLAGDGAFAFTLVPPGDYRILITNTAVAVAPVAPADWTFDAPAPPDTALLGAITPVVMTNADLADQHLGLYRGRDISGEVYHDLAPYGVKDGAEDWTAAPTVYVNLVLTGAIKVAGVDYPADHVWDSATVPAGPGGYAFTNVPPGPYRLVVAGTDTAIVSAPPAGWVFVQPETGTRALTIADADHVDQDFGLTPGRTVSGHVYNDIIPNSVRDIGLEDWTGAPSLYVNLVRVSTNTVWASRQVNAGPGDYEFTDVIPGEFRLVVANASGDTTAAPPSTWRFRSPLDGSRLIDVAAADIDAQDFGLFRGRTVKGHVFRDDGSGGGTPNDGLRNGSEAGLGNVTVRLLSATATQLDITQTDGSGNFTLRIPAETLAGATLILEELNPGGHRSTGATLGAHGDSYDRATDRLAFTYPDDDVDGFAFGDVPANQLLTDGAQTVLPGATATYRHTYIAGTGGTVVFTIDPSAAPADVPWSHVLHRDNDCDGQVGAGDPVLLGAPITVTAGQEVCLLLVTHAPGGAPYGAVATARLVATFTYDNAAPALADDELIRQDVTTVGATASAGLELTKAVDKTTARPGEEITYTITYTNVGAETLRELFIYDTTPAYTVFVSASYGLTPASLTGEPIDAPAPDATGAIRWEFTGELEPGGTGTVIFTIRVSQ